MKHEAHHHWLALWCRLTMTRYHTGGSRQDTHNTTMFEREGCGWSQTATQYMRGSAPQDQHAQPQHIKSTTSDNTDVREKQSLGVAPESNTRVDSPCVQRAQGSIQPQKNPHTVSVSTQHAESLKTVRSTDVARYTTDAETHAVTQQAWYDEIDERHERDQRYE